MSTRVPARVVGVVAAPAQHVRERVHEERARATAAPSTAKNPTTRPLHPPMRKHATPSDHGPIQSCLLRKRELGVLGEVLDRRRTRSSPYLSHRIHPTWLHQKPRFGEWMSRSVSAYRWWSRWCAGPPQRTLLRGASCRRTPSRTAGTRAEPVAAVREVPVVAGGDRRTCGRGTSRRTGRTAVRRDPGEDREQRDEVQGDERDRRALVDALVGAGRRGGRRARLPVGSSVAVTQRLPGRARVWGPTY